MHDTPRLENLENTQKQSKPVHTEDQQAQSFRFPSTQLPHEPGGVQKGLCPPALAKGAESGICPFPQLYLKCNEEGKKAKIISTLCESGNGDFHRASFRQLGQLFQPQAKVVCTEALWGGTEKGCEMVNRTDGNRSHGAIRGGVGGWRGEEQ